MTTTTRISVFNKVFITLLAAAAVLCLARGAWALGLALLAAIAFVGWSVQRARAGKGSDFERVSAAQPFDERDALTIERGFAILGMFAFILQTLLFVWAAAMHPAEINSEAARLLVLALALGVANAVALRRA